MNLLSLPIHPLVVHVAVTLIPLAAVVAMAHGLRDDWRWWLRLPSMVVNALALVVLFVTRATGDQLAHATPDNKALIEEHDQMAGLLTIATVPMTLLAIFAAWSFAATSGATSGWGANEARQTRFASAVKWLVVLLGIAVLVFTVLTGHSGATAAWSK